MVCVNYYIDDGLFGFYLFLIGLLFALIFAILLWRLCIMCALNRTTRVTDVKQFVKYSGKIEQRKLLKNLNTFKTNNGSSTGHQFIFHNNFDKWKSINRNYINTINHVDMSNLFSVNESVIREDITGFNDLEFHYRNERITGHKQLQHQFLNFLRQQKLISQEDCAQYCDNVKKKYKDLVDEYNYQCDAYLTELRLQAPKNTSDSEMQAVIAEKFPQRADQLSNNIVNNLSSEIREIMSKVQNANQLSNEDVESILSMYWSSKSRLDEFISQNKAAQKDRNERRLENLKFNVNEDIIDNNVQEIGYKERETVFNVNIISTLPDITESEKKRIFDEYKKNVNNIKDQHRSDLMRQRQELALRMEKARNEDLEEIFVSYDKDFSKYSQLAEKESLDQSKDSLKKYQRLKMTIDEDVNIAIDNWHQKEITFAKKMKDTCNQSIEEEIDEMEYGMMQQLYNGHGIDKYDVNNILREHRQNVNNIKNNVSIEKERQMKKMNNIISKRQERNDLELNNGVKVQLEEEEKRHQIVNRAMDDQMELPLEMRNKILEDSQSNEINIRNQLISLKNRQQKQIELALAKKMTANLAMTTTPIDSSVLAQVDMFEEEVKKVDIDREKIILEMRDKLATETKTILDQYEDQICNIMAIYQVSHAKKLRKKKNLQTLLTNLCTEMSHPAFQHNPLATEQVIEQFNNDKSNLENMKISAQEEQKRQMEKKLEEKKSKITKQKEGELKRRFTDQLLVYKEIGVSDAALAIADETLVEKMKEETENAVKLELNKETEVFERSQERNDEDMEKALLDKQKDILSRLVLINDMTPSQISDMIDGINPNLDEEMKKTIVNEIKRKTNQNMKEKPLFQFQKDDIPTEEPRNGSREKMKDPDRDDSQILTKKKKKRRKKREEDPDVDKVDSDF